MKKLWMSLVAIMMGVGLVVSAPTVMAASCDGVETAILECDDGDGVNHILSLVVDIMTMGVGILGVLGITIVGIQYLTAGGSEEKTRKAKQRILEIVIGVALFVALAAIIKFLNVKT